MDLKDRLRTQWAESVEDWLHQNQAVRTGMLDSWMLESLGDISGKRVIDIGCGEGRFCRLITGLGAETTGIDLTAALVERARSLAVGRERYLVGNAEHLSPIDDESFDLAVSYIVLVDLLDYRSSIQAAFRVLRPWRTVYRLQRTPDAVFDAARLDQTGKREAVLRRRQLHDRRPSRV